MYKLLLVDDEREIVNGLLEVIPFESLGFTVVGQAENGLEGLHLSESLNPDLIITDIRMPLMDGLAMCREIRKQSPTAHFLILTGYDDIEFARQAIAFRSMDYLLKPITSTELIAVLRDTRQKLDEEFAVQRNISKLKADFSESLPLLREMLLSSFLCGGADASAILSDAQRYQMDLVAPQYAVAVMRTPTALNALPADLSDPNLAQQAVINIAREVLDRHLPAQVFHYDGMIAMLFLLPDASEQSFAHVQEALGAMHKTISRFLDIKLSIGLSMPCFSPADLPACSRQAISALEHSILRAEGDILSIADIEPGSRTELVANEVALRSLTNALKMGNHDEAMQTLTTLMQQLHKPTPNNYRVYLMEILLTLLRTARDMNVDIDILGNNNEILNALMNEPNTEAAYKILFGLADQLQTAIQSGRASASFNLAQQAAAFLGQNYVNPDMSVDLLCRELHVSSSYLSAVYKQEMKETFHQTLTRLRMDLSMQLLTTTTLKTTEIAASVGLPDPSYFSHAFKRYFGVSPLQARAGKRGEPS